MYILIRHIQDNSGMVHPPGEAISVVTAMKRADFDDRTVYHVVFSSNGNNGILFDEEIKNNEIL